RTGRRGRAQFDHVAVSASARAAVTRLSKEFIMLENKTAVIYGGGGAIGGAVARAFSDAGARVYLAGRSKDRLEAVAKDIDAAGVGEVDALDEHAVAEHADAVAADAGGIDISLNA